MGRYIMVRAGMAAAMLAAICPGAMAQQRCVWIDGVEHCGGGTTTVLTRRSGDYLEAYGRNRQVRKAMEADEQDALERRNCRADAVAAAKKGQYRKARALSEICP